MYEVRTNDGIIILTDMDSKSQAKALANNIREIYGDESLVVEEV